MGGRVTAGAKPGRTRPNQAYMSMMGAIHDLIKHRTTAICDRVHLKRLFFIRFRLVSICPFRARARNRVGFRKSGLCPLPGRPRPRGYFPKAPKAQMGTPGGIGGPLGVFLQRNCMSISLNRGGMCISSPPGKSASPGYWMVINSPRGISFRLLFSWI